MSVAGFVVANLAGTLVRLYLIRRVGETFEAPIDDVLGFIGDYRVPLLIASTLLFGFMMVNELRQAKGEVEAIADTLDDDGEDPPVS